MHTGHGFESASGQQRCVRREVTVKSMVAGAGVSGCGDADVLGWGCADVLGCGGADVLKVGREMLRGGERE